MALASDSDGEVVVVALVQVLEDLVDLANLLRAEPLAPGLDHSRVATFVLNQVHGTIWKKRFTCISKATNLCNR